MKLSKKRNSRRRTTPADVADVVEDEEDEKEKETSSEERMKMVKPKPTTKETKYSY